MIFCRDKNKRIENLRTDEIDRINPFKKALLVTGGVVSLALGLIGIPVPMLPTTPFLLLSAYLFARSSQRLYKWLIYHRYFGKYIRDYREKRGVPMKVKIGSIALLWATILFSAFWVVDLVWVRLLLIVVAIGVTSHILCLKTIR
ncbi:MAG: YbaN family protein [Bacteroidales bacterium]|nr:YbaN family protein [Bacteroidales bacterium]